MEPRLFDGVTKALMGAGVPGCALGITDRDTTVELYTFGSASLSPSRPVAADTVFHLFSGTKLYTATALMLLVENGAVELDVPIQHYLPSLGLRHEITVRQLAAHHSGLADTLRAFVAVHRPSDTAPSTGEALARYRLDNGRPPGGEARYRNVNYALLGELIAQQTGTSYTDFVQQSVLNPLNADADFFYRSDLLDRQATGFMPRWSPVRPAMRWLMPGTHTWLPGQAVGRLVPLAAFNLDTAAIGGLVGSARGFLPLLREMLSGDDGLLRASSKREMLTPHSTGAAGVMSRDGVGIGWKLGSIDGTPFWNHEGGGPGFCSETRLYPSEGFGMVILTNLSQNRRLSTLCHQICELIRQDLAR
ncbi:MAG: serine hydrolase domain-containing protein [Acidimicrobiales bacterium]